MKKLNHSQISRKGWKTRREQERTWKNDMNDIFAVLYIGTGLILMIVMVAIGSPIFQMFIAGFMKSMSV